jgi:flagellar biosynthesis GTPase FlhF
MWRVEEIIGNGPDDRQLIYYGPGPSDTDEEEIKRKQAEAQRKAKEAQAQAEAAAKRDEEDKKKAAAKKAAADKAAADKAAADKAAADKAAADQAAADKAAAEDSLKKKEQVQATRSAAPPPPPPAAKAPSPPPAPPPTDPEEDDETILKLVDGTTVPAEELEKILKKHLEAVEHVMVVGSGKDFLSCMLTLKTKGSEAVARGQDPAALESTKDELAKEALELAQRFGSTATRVIDARQCQKFRGEGLLPLFAKANAEIKQSAQQVLGAVSLGVAVLRARFAFSQLALL